MIDDPLPFASRPYLWMFGLLFFARSMDFLSTWIATPTLALEGNPLAKKLGWRLGMLVNLAVCFTFAFWHLTAIIIATTGLLVAAHNFRLAWLMRSMGEENYRSWHIEQVRQTRPALYLFCLFGQTALTAAVGAVLLLSSRFDSIAFAVGLGIIAFAAVVLFYTLLGVWRIRRRGFW